MLGVPPSYVHTYSLECDNRKRESRCTGNDEYGKHLCECDRFAAHCFRRTRSDFNRFYVTRNDFDTEIFFVEKFLPFGTQIGV